MGCACRKPETQNNNNNNNNNEEEEEDEDPNFFRVINIDQDGNDHLPGRIEVTSEYLILHQGKKQCIQWPIRTLRRYGFEFNIFSFEAGRRCPTGEGIFAFRCVRAEQLFRLLQANIQMTCNTSNMPHADISQNNYLEPRAVGVTGYRLESIGSSSSVPHTPVSPTQTSSSIYSFDEKDLKVNSNSTNGKGCGLVTIPKNPSSSSPLYVNVETGTDEDRKASTSHNPYLSFPEKLGKHYMELPEDEGEGKPNSQGTLQYILVDVDNKPSSPVIKTSTKENKVSVGYTTIDFQKTWALLQTTKPNIQNDIGCKRKTRHNSNLFGVQR